MSKSSSLSDVDSVRDATDLVRLIGEHIALKSRGREHIGLCPFHDDKNPSMAVVTHKGNAFYKCHSCGAGGDVFDFVMNYHRMEFGEALRFLADRAGIKLTPRRPQGAGGVGTGGVEGEQQGGGGGPKRIDLRKANAFAGTFFQRTLTSPAGAAAREVISARGISDEMVQAFMLGAAPDQWDALTNLIKRKDLPEQLFVAAGLLKNRKEGEGCYDAFRNRLIFPICDELGNPIAFGARKINPEDEPKYLNSAESAVFSKSKTLFGLHRAKRVIIDAKQAIITEGYTDVIACHQAGICNVVGTLGTALTHEHARMLTKLCDTVVLVFDGDEAGMKAADRGLGVFFAEPVDVKVCALPDELDPDELLKLEGGRDRFAAAITGAVDAMEYKLQRFQRQLDGAGGLSARQKRLEQFLAELVQLGFGELSGVRRSMVLARLAQMVGVAVGDVERALPRQKRAEQLGAVASEPAPYSAWPSLVDVDSTAPATPARLRAERDLLSILIFEPSLQTQLLELGSRKAGVLELFQPHDFAEPSMRQLASAVWRLLTTGGSFTVQQLLAEFADDHLKKLASALYFEGERLSENAVGGVAVCLQIAVESLSSHVGLQQFEQAVQSFRQTTHRAADEALAAAQAVLEQRRRQGQIAFAIGRGVRS